MTLRTFSPPSRHCLAWIITAGSVCVPRKNAFMEAYVRGTVGGAENDAHNIETARRRVVTRQASDVTSCYR